MCCVCFFPGPRAELSGARQLRALAALAEDPDLVSKANMVAYNSISSSAYLVPLLASVGTAHT